ncbi:hypothetical protein BU26DRAFT_551012 [Trematosphaeria pertusa]|uniref:Calcofluor white hypersensitive protein n=1 Tax=Trematosphaeria pertusa TaxID=390896 RepID=A0A6A6IF57_9PLEO|nr:uncharacterized protein BU26DRAFT_551012 [Trematosphaeria pertusa]KAF2249215.1 hypothetical protein BU26DRAFT_551012 [Trematosphaeria pertusa]
MSGKRLLTFGGLAAVGGGAYYLYSAGGDPKLAQKQLEHDAASASAKVRGEMPGREKEAKKAGEEGYETVRAKAQSMADEAKAEVNKAGKTLDAYRQDAGKKLEETRQTTGKDFNAAVDKFDKKVTEGARETKSWFGSWFGGK